MSKDKYPSIYFRPNGDYCLYYPSNLFMDYNDPHSQKEHAEIHKIPKFNVNQASFD